MTRPNRLLAGLPNLITVARIFLVPAVVVLIAYQAWLGAFVLFLVAGASDAVDGFIARRFDLRSDLGAHLDPLADKALLVSIYVTLAIIGAAPLWLAVVVVSRDIMIIGAVIVSWVLDRPVEIRPLPISKVNTAMQIILAGLVLGDRAFALDLHAWTLIVSLLVAGLTLTSAAAYLANWLSHMSDGTDAHAG